MPRVQESDPICSFSASWFSENQLPPLQILPNNGIQRLSCMPTRRGGPCLPCWLPQLGHSPIPGEILACMVVLPLFLFSCKETILHFIPLALQPDQLDEVRGQYCLEDFTSLPIIGI